MSCIGDKLALRVSREVLRWSKLTELRNADDCSERAELGAEVWWERYVALLTVLKLISEWLSSYSAIVALVAASSFLRFLRFTFLYSIFSHESPESSRYSRRPSQLSWSFVLLRFEVLRRFFVSAGLICSMIHLVLVHELEPCYIVFEYRSNQFLSTSLSLPCFRVVPALRRSACSSLSVFRKPRWLER